MTRYAMDYHVVNLLVSGTTDTAALPWVDLAYANWCDFHFCAPVINTDSIDVTIEESITGDTTTPETEVAIPFRYRVLDAAGGDTIGTLTTADSAGIGMDSASGEALLHIISIDPKDLDDGYRFVRIKIAQQANTASGTTFWANAILQPRYAQAVPLSTTA